MRAVRATAICLWALALAALGVPASALAGTYDVKSCTASAAQGEYRSGWVASVRTGEPVQTPAFCYSTTQGGGDSGISYVGSETVRPELPLPYGSPTTAAAGRVGGITLTAPAGSTITHITYHRKLQSTDPAWDMRLAAGSTVLDDCQATDLQTPCADTAPGGVFSSDLPAGTTSLDLAAFCVQAPCAYPTGSTYTFGAAVYSATITIQDTTAPAAPSITTGTLSNGWLGAATPLTVQTSDPGGIEDVQLVEAGKVVADAPSPGCVDWSPEPCADASYGVSATLKHAFAGSDLKVTDGEHTLVARATDAAGNTTDSAPITVNIDKTPPTPVVRDGDDGPAQQRTITWTTPAGGSPLASATVEVCPLDLLTSLAPGCTTSSAPPAGPFTFDLPSAKSSAEVHVSLVDEAGNYAQSGPVYPYRDAIPPANPTVAAFGVTGTARTFIVADDDESSDRIHPRLCQGSTCTDLPTVVVLGPSTQFSVPNPAPGDYRLEVRMADKYDNLSDPATTTFTVGAAVKVAQLGAGIGSPVGAGGSGKAMTIVPILPKKLSGSTILVRGTVTPGAASQVSVLLAGRLKSGKSTGTSKAVKPAANGKFAVRLRLASKLNRSKGVLLTIAATPNAGFALAKVRARIKG